MSGLLDMLNPVKALVDTVNGVISNFVPNANDKLRLQGDMFKVTSELQSKLIDADLAFANAQRDVVVAEAKSDSFLAKNWRPITMLTFTFIIAWNYIVVPLSNAPKVDVPPDLWGLMKLGMGGYIIGRSVEKAAPSVISAIKGNGS